MKERKKIILTLATLTLACTGTAMAAGHEQGGPSFSPLEIYGCTFNDGKGMSDLAKVNARWNSWMDREQRNDYWAYMLAPMFHSDELKADMLWVGGWADGATMADSTQHWLAQGGDLQAEYGKVVSCAAHVLFAVYDLKRNDYPGAAGPVEFTNCTLKENRTVREAVMAAEQWIEYQAEHDVMAGHYLMFPAWGARSDHGYDFKWVSTYDFDQLGKSFDQYGTGGGWRKADELFGNLMDCDSSRIYHATQVRNIDTGE